VLCHGIARTTESPAQVLLPHADEVLHLMPHGVHGVMGLVAVERPATKSMARSNLVFLNLT